MLALVACGRSQGIDDKDLGGLVVTTKQADKGFDVAKAAGDPVELGHALTAPYTRTVAVLGAHELAITTETTVEEAGKQVSTLTDTTKLVVGEPRTRAFHGTYDNSADYGREVIYADKKLYLKPRYQRWHERTAEAPDEPTTLRDQFADAIGATWELLAPAAELSDRGAQTVDGRAGKKIEIKRMPTPGANPPETLSQRKWREARTIDAVAGEVVIDSDSGVPLSVKLTGAISYLREGKRYTMKVSLTSAVSAIGKPSDITAPTTDVVATPERLREVDDRDFLLQGIAPPLRKNADGTAVAPQPKELAGSGAGSAAPPPAPTKAKAKDSK